MDNYTDAIMLLSAAYDGEEDIIEKAANSYAFL